MNTTTGVMHNLPVLWLVVGLLSICHALVAIVGQLNVALLLCLVHAVQCAVSVPGLCSRQQWRLVWVGPRVLLCSRAETGHRSGCGQPWHKDCNQPKGPNFCLSLSTPFRVSSSKKKSRIVRNETEEVREQPWAEPTLGLAQSLCNELTSSIVKSTCRNVWLHILLLSVDLVTTTMLC